ncbi:hypothetical protein CCHL11_00382 [Colletotrichum chlorophyti]|uniref:Uncharacterized protein n=1 Tax=Colletotrichum chlorophyti TaxID=708187 RepID=A0A1Q8RUR0_9PEZI|nr:hypothetical protein CCHL11_00382 [Colletotrichum chlorophyti]
MESKTSLLPLGDDRRSFNQSPSALRAFTPSRLTRRPSRRNSYSTSSSSSSSSIRSSIDSTASPSCVFIVWAAVQRNLCQKMTAADRLECPLLRCRKRFPNHELMLRHLYSCDQLSTGEYWCYECGKAEKFTDGKCKRCLGHPGKRRRIMSIAKDFFSSLGQKSKAQHVPDLAISHAVDLATAQPPSYDSLHVQPCEIELSSSTEILEADSREVPSPLPTNTFDNPTEIKPAGSVDLQPTEFVPTMSVIPDLPLDWAMQSSFDTAESVMRLDRPSLSVYTHGLGQYDKPHKPATRTKHLSPSASLRSTASTATTDLVSPASAFSGFWTSAETSITSPTCDNMSNMGNLSRGCSNASRYSNYSMPHSVISELPAEDVMFPPLPVTIPDDLGYNQPYLPLETLTNAAKPNDTSTIPSEKAQDVPFMTDKTAVSSTSFHAADANSLVGSAWDALKAHISFSVEKLQYLSQNPLAGQLRSLSPAQIADTGLMTLNEIIEGRQPTSGIGILCFVHITYALSIIVHEDDTRNRSKQLFAQAFSYGSMLTTWERPAYLELASAIWGPLDLSADEMIVLLSEHREGSIYRSSSKGKECAAASSTYRPNYDILVDIAHFFLDELEHAALSSRGRESTEVMASTLWTSHLFDLSVNMPIDEGFVTALTYVKTQLCRKFSHVVGLGPKSERALKRIRSGKIRSVRRAELKLIQAGKGCIPPQEYFDSYVPQVRVHFEGLYKEPLTGITRTIYHRHGIDLMKTILSGIVQKEASEKAIQHPQQTPVEGDLDEFMRVTTTGLYESLDSFMAEGQVTTSELLPGIEPEVIAFAPQVPAATFSVSSKIPAAGNLEAPPHLVALHNASPTGPLAVPSGSLPQKVEVEADDGCRICGYRPKGDPQWFKGSMAKHMKNKHSSEPPKIYRCPFPGCTSEFTNRADNLKQHQESKGHFVGEESERRPSKRKRKTKD